MGLLRNECCNIITKYKARDGKLFDTQEACQKWNDRKVVYEVTNYGSRARYMFISLKEAQAYCDRNKNQDTSILTLDIIIPHEFVSPHSRITNTPTKGWWSKIKEWNK